MERPVDLVLTDSVPTDNEIERYAKVMPHPPAPRRYKSHLTIMEVQEREREDRF